MRRIALLFVAIAVSYAAGLDPALAHTTGSGWIAAVVGLYHGVVGTIPEFMGGSGYNALPDIAVAAVILCVLGREVSARARPAWARIVVRVAGSWIAAAGILLLAFSLRIQFGLGVGPRG